MKLKPAKCDFWEFGKKKQGFLLEFLKPTGLDEPIHRIEPPPPQFNKPAKRIKHIQQILISNKEHDLLLKKQISQVMDWFFY